MNNLEFLAELLLAKANLDEARAYALLKNDAFVIANLKIAKKRIDDVLDKCASETGVFYLAE